ncbi:MAG: hypothetical protein QXS41_02725 [Candidatus Woesearchaeota archaeon]
MKKFIIFLIIFHFIYFSLFSFTDSFTIDNVFINVTYCNPYVSVILNDSFTYYLIFDTFQEVAEFNSSKNLTNYFGELYFIFGNLTKVYYSNQFVTNLNLNVNSLQTKTFSMSATIDGAIKSAKLRINDNEYNLPISYDNQNKKTKIQFSNSFSFDFSNATLIYQDFCNTTYNKAIDVKYYSKDTGISFSTDKETYASDDLVKLNVTSNYPAKLDILDENNNVLISNLLLSLNSINSISLSSISVVDYRIIKFKVHNEINSITKEILIYNPEKYVCEILSDTFYRNEENIVKIKTNADSVKLYQLNSFISDCNTSACLAKLTQKDPLTLKCFYNVNNKKFEIITTKTFNFAEKKYLIEFEIFDSLKKYALTKYQITIKNKNSNYQVILKDKPSTELIEGIYDVSVSAGSNYLVDSREIYVNSNRKIQFYLNEVQEFLPMELLIYNLNKYSDLISITGSVKNANSCEFYEGKNDVFIKLQEVNATYFNIKFKGVLGFDYFLICTNQRSRELFVIFENFDRTQVRIIQQQEFLNRTKEEKNVNIFDLLLTIDYLKSQFISLFSFYQGLEPELIILVEKVYYENFLEETKFLKSLNDRIVYYLKDVDAEGITFNVSTSFIDIINILSKIEILEKNLKSLYKVLSNETVLNEFGKDYFMIPEKDKKRLETLDVRLPIKFHVSKFEYVQLNYEPIKEYVKYRCVVDRVTLTSFYRENSTVNYFYRISCPVTPALVVFEGNYQVIEDSTQKYFNKKPIYAFVPLELESAKKYLEREEKRENAISLITGNFINFASKNSTMISLILVISFIFITFYYINSKVISKEANKKINKVEKKASNVNQKESLQPKTEVKKEPIKVDENFNTKVSEKAEKNLKQRKIEINKIKEGKILIKAIEELNSLIKKSENIKSFEERNKLYHAFLDITNQVDPVVNDLEFFYLPQISSELKQEFQNYLNKYKELRESIYRIFL